ncbi:hypothetical protein BKE79_21950 [Salmonella enterica]|nr:hypothetical protein [Salmonella enterica]ECH7872953.1 hypothetical protein [Salmonella enterica subsp. enterica serovar Rubislaw]EHN5366340.1 hypothetical protein [Salmonella enterica subsp. enterica serovar Oranienburg]EHO6898489.1 hypothetical protein [Salmonella enterica subsp. enterica serovar Oranienburg]
MENRIILPFFVQGCFCNEFEEELTTSHFEFTTKARFFDLSAAGGALYEVACALAPTVVPAIAYIIHGWIKKKRKVTIITPAKFRKFHWKVILRNRSGKSFLSQGISK